MFGSAPLYYMLGHFTTSSIAILPKKSHNNPLSFDTK